jgi:hypothetical protein
MMQKYNHGDHVKVAENYSCGWRYENGVESPIPSEWAGKEAIVTGSYNDQFWKPNTGGDYTLFFKRQGDVSWFPEKALTLIKENATGLMEQWKQDRKEEIKVRSDIDWIFSNGKEVIENPHMASIATLANCFGLTNLCGSHGEGFVYYENAMRTLKVARPFLEACDKTGYLERCKEILVKFQRCG